MTINSRQKGKRAELEVARILREHGYDCRRGCQYNGSDGSADVVGLPGIHLEIKRVERLNLSGAMSQAIADCKENIPTVWHRKNNEQWLVTMRAEDWLSLYKDWEVHQ